MRRETQSPAVVIALAMVSAALLLTACGSASSIASPPVKQGGTVVIGAGGEPACADWYAICGRNVWGIYMMATQTLIGPYRFVNGRDQPSPLLSGPADVRSGPPQQIVYHINPRAVWSDGQPVSSADFQFTLQQARRLSSMEGVSVDDHDPNTAIITYAVPNPDWGDDFTPLLPAHLLQGKDVETVMRDGYSFSDGPWLIDHWTRGQEVKLVPNPRYWGDKPKLAAVIFKIITDPASYLSAYQTGQIDVAYVFSAAAGVQVVRSVAHTHYDIGQVLQVQSIYFNTQRPPLDSPRVRQALAYATDRNAIVATVYGTIAPGLKPAQSYMPPADQQWYSEPFAMYSRKLDRVAKLMTSDGWVRGPDGLWAKNGAHAAVSLLAVPNASIALIDQALQSQWHEAGFDVSIDTGATSIDRVTKGDFSVVVSTIAPPGSGPSFLCFRLCSSSIATQGNNFQGGNYSRYSDSTLDGLLHAGDAALDTSRRVQLVREAQQRIADTVPLLPIAGVPDMLAYNTAKVGGPIVNDPSGPFVNLDRWYCSSRCS